MKKRRRKKLIIGFLAIAMVFMGVGYALLSENLDVVVTTESNGSWDVVIESITTKTVNGNAVSKSVSHNDLTANFLVELYTLGDYIEYEVKVKNNGNIPAQLTAITPSVPDTGGVIGFTNDAVLNEIIAPGSYKIITVKISVDSSSEVDMTNSRYSLTLVYTQYVGELPSYDNYDDGGSSTPVQEDNMLRILSASGNPVLDLNNMSSLDFGAVLGFGTSKVQSNEQFYIIGGNGSTTFMLLSRYLINSGPHQKTTFGVRERDTRGLQDKNIGYSNTRTSSSMDSEVTTNGYLYGSTAFAASNYWWSNNDYVSGYSEGSSAYTSSSIKPYVDNYISTLNSMGFKDVIEDLVGTTVNITGGLLEYNYVNALCGGNLNGPTTDVSNCPSFLFDTTYWLASVYDESIYTAVTNGSIPSYNLTTTKQLGYSQYDNNMAYGIRPVITVTIPS